MIKRLKTPILLGLSFYSVAFVIVSSLGFNSYSFSIISYLYIILAVILGLKYESNFRSPLAILKNIVVVVEDEETHLRRLINGEKYKIKGEIERV